MTRIRQIGQHYVIDEIVTKDGLYITWQEVFNSEAQARRYLKRKGYNAQGII